MKRFNRAGRKRQRHVNTRTQAFERILIITEGKSTELHYFNSIKKQIQERYRENLIIDKLDIDVSGAGRGTMKVVEAALKSRNRHTYCNVWVVFDKDNFPDFDEAIQFAVEQGLSVAWSNQSFELWLLLHFQDVTTAMDNKVLIDKLNGHLIKSGQSPYTKEQPLLYNDLDDYVHSAIECSKRLLEYHEEKGITVPSKMNPATTVHTLIEELIPYLKFK